MGLNTQCHDGVDNIIVVLLQRLDGLLAADVGLGHDELDVLVLQTLGINLLTIILIVVLLGLGGLGGLSGVTVVVTGVVTFSTGSGELCGGGLLRAGVDVLDLGLTENTMMWSAALSSDNNMLWRSHVGVAVGGLVNLGVVDDEENL